MNWYQTSAYQKMKAVFSNLAKDYHSGTLVWAKLDMPDMFTRMKNGESVINEQFKSVCDKKTLEEIVKNINYYAFIVQELKSGYVQAKGPKPLPF